MAAGEGCLRLRGEYVSVGGAEILGHGRRERVTTRKLSAPSHTPTARCIRAEPETLLVFVCLSFCFFLFCYHCQADVHEPAVDGAASVAAARPAMEMVR